MKVKVLKHVTKYRKGIKYTVSHIRLPKEFMENCKFIDEEYLNAFVTIFNGKPVIMFSSLENETEN